MYRWRVLEELLLHAVAVEPGEHHQLERDRGRRETARLEIAGIQLDMRTTNVRQWLEMVLVAPVEPQTQLGGVRLPSAW